MGAPVCGTPKPVSLALASAAFLGGRRVLQRPLYWRPGGGGLKGELCGKGLPSSLTLKFSLDFSVEETLDIV